MLVSLTTTSLIPTYCGDVSCRREEQILKEFNSIELFAGAGGLALGLSLSGLSVKGLIEKDVNCCETLRSNAPRYFPEARIVMRDIRSLSVSETLRLVKVAAREIDVISGGPPCQPFSIASIPKGSFNAFDSRETLVWHFARFVRKIRPTAFVFENVPGMLTKSGGTVFRSFIQAMKRLNYRIGFKIVNAADYGVPQLRRRLFVFGSRKHIPIVLPYPTHGRGISKKSYLTIADALSKLTPNLPNQRVPTNSESKKRSLARIRPGSEWKHWRHRDKWGAPSRCLTAHCKDDWVHPLYPRSGTVRELASLQTFPHDYEFCGTFYCFNGLDTQHQYKQVGNAVPVALAKVIGQAILDHLQY